MIFDNSHRCSSVSKVNVLERRELPLERGDDNSGALTEEGFVLKWRGVIAGKCLKFFQRKMEHWSGEKGESR